MNPIIILIYFEIILILALNELSSYLVYLSFKEKYNFMKHLFLAPGTILHELFHALAVLCCFGKIREIKFYTIKQQESDMIGYVDYTISQNILYPIKTIIISLAPLFVGCFSVLFIINRFFGIIYDASLPFGSSIYSHTIMMFTFLYHNLILNISEWYHIALLFLIAIVGGASAPSNYDINSIVNFKKYKTLKITIISILVAVASYYLNHPILNEILIGFYLFFLISLISIIAYTILIILYLLFINLEKNHKIFILAMSISVSAIVYFFIKNYFGLLVILIITPLILIVYFYILKYFRK